MTRKYAVLVVLAVVVFAVSRFSFTGQAQTPGGGQSTPSLVPPVASDQGNQEFVLTETAIGAFKYGGATYDIWASLYNREGKPRLWQFRYAPVFRAQVKADGKLDAAMAELPDKSWRVLLPLHADTVEAGTEAFEAVKRRYPDQADQIRPESIHVLNIRNLVLEVEGLTTHIPTAKLTNKQIEFFDTVSTFTLQIDVPDRDTAKQVADYLAVSRIRYELNFAAKIAKENVIQIKMSQIRKSKLYDKLNGLGTTEVYVHRDDMRALCEGISTVVDSIGIIEVPEKLDEAIFLDLVNDWSKRAHVEGEAFKNNTANSIYNKTDLDPTVLTKTMTKMFDYNEGKNEYKYNGSVDTSASFGLLQVLNAEAKLKGTYSAEELKYFLKKHDIDVELEGKLIKPKSLDLRQVNIGTFKDDSKVLYERTYITGTTGKGEKGHIDLSRVSEKFYPDLPTRFAVLEKKVTDLGSAINYSNEKRNALAAFVDNNMTRIAWKEQRLKTPADNAQKGERETWGDFLVDFSPNTPLSGPEDVYVLISGISCQRDEEKVSNLYAVTKDIKRDGTKISGKYRFNLSDHDNNSSYNDDTRLTILVIAKIKPVGSISKE